MELLYQTSQYDLSKYCRTCFSECEIEGYNVETFSDALLRLFKQCVPYERAQKNLINLLCPLCYETLRSFEEFRSKALARTYLLERFLKLKKLASDNKNVITNNLQQKFSNEDIVPKISSKTVCSASEGNAVRKWNNIEPSEQYEQVMYLEELETDPAHYEDSSMRPKISISSELNEQIVEKEHDIESSDQDFEEILQNAIPETEEFINETLECPSSLSNVNKIVKLKRTTKARKSENSKLPKNGIYTCSHCDHNFQYTMTLSKHLTEIHQLKPTFTACPHESCNKMFQHNETAMQHYRISHVLEVQKNATCICELCGESFENEQKLKQHRCTTHEPDAETGVCEDKILQSPTCQSNGNKPLQNKFRRKGSLKRTAKSNKKVLPKHRLYSCSHCERSFYYSMSLSKHLTEAHNLKQTFTLCPDENCNKTFQHDEAAILHYRYNHQLQIQNDISCICELCGETFENEQKLKHHHYKHDPDTRPFHCEICDKRFILKRYLKEHQLRHAGIKEYQCPHCEMKKTSARELRAHMNVHRQDREFPCPLCSRVFRWPSALKLHDQIFHKGIRRFICRYCDKPFGKPENLKYHERRHIGEKPYECKTCGLKFISLAALLSHNKTKSHIKKTQDKDLTEVTDLEEPAREIIVSTSKTQ